MMLRSKDDLEPVNVGRMLTDSRSCLDLNII